MDEADKAEGVVEADAPDIGEYGQDEAEAPAPEDAGQSSSDAPEGAKAGTTWEELAEKKGFKSPDDLARAYSELESHNKTVEMDRAELLKAREGKEEEPKSEAPADDKSNKVLAQVLREQRELKEKLEIKELFDQHKDASRYAKAMADHVKRHPNATWEQAYRYVKFDDLEAEAKKKGIEEAYTTQKEKGRYAVARSGAKALPKNLQGVNIMDRSIPLSDIEKMLPHG